VTHEGKHVVASGIFAEQDSSAAIGVDSIDVFTNPYPRRVPQANAVIETRLGFRYIPQDQGLQNPL
jgi:hypothetical protein